MKPKKPRTEKIVVYVTASQKKVITNAADKSTASSLSTWCQAVLLEKAGVKTC